MYRRAERDASATSYSAFICNIKIGVIIATSREYKNFGGVADKIRLACVCFGQRT